MKKKLLALLILGVVLSLPLNGQNKRPNVLLLLVDDLKPTLGSYGDDVAVSPNIDNLASQGMRFDMAYCNQAVCMASRYNLMLGARSTSTGIYNFGTQFRDVYPDAVTMPQYFKNAGYHVESMGKVFHIGHGNTNDEASWSIPHHKEKVIEYLLPESTNGKLTREEAYFENSHMFIEDLPRNKALPRGAAWESPDVLDEAYADGRVAAHAIDRLRQLRKNKEKPFFMAVGFARPHLPFCAPKKYWDLYSPDKLPMPEFEGFPENAPGFAGKRRGEISQFKPIPENESGIYDADLKQKLIHGYYASMSYMDAQLGRVINELKRLKMDKNTIIVLWGDHGWHLGDHGTWTKHTNYEQANHIPILIVAPGVTKPGSSTQHLIETVDIYPTLADLAGLPKPNVSQPIDGMSLMPVLKNGRERIKNHAYHAYQKEGYLGEAIRTAQYRMVRWSKKENSNLKTVYELYDYKNDFLETKNIAGDNPQLVKKMEKLLNSHPEARR
ncbi:sulfatase [Flavivirga sp. 57AJ16]|uniref:sulfatase n=1 Tax=Flavivirga sp. 57AJ16 TaxID=3025307 RepID=UPI0023668664|nr:sulfatase [Flavivirga sp. 57AJ16]MDD7885393.1 sulfatase [Flavivirga sp. 57AJ16]